MYLVYARGVSRTSLDLVVKEVDVGAEDTRILGKRYVLGAAKE